MKSESRSIHGPAFLLIIQFSRGKATVWVTVGGMLLGAFALHVIDLFVPHEHFIRGPEGPSSHLRKIWLFILAITIHNFPEGLAVGVGFLASLAAGLATGGGCSGG